MLANPLFKNSKRYPNLLRHIVERTLEGQQDDLRERTLGVEVFGREPNYDTNSDPVVRATAGEIRKRIAQYYHEHGREGEIRIELSPGSYVPEFEMPSQQALAPAAPPQAVTVPGPRTRKLPLALGLVLAAVPLIGAMVWLMPMKTRPALDRFWSPVLDSSSSVLLCVGQRQFLGSSPETPDQSSRDLPRAGSPGATTLFKLYYMGSQNVAFPDVMTLARLTGLLQAKGKTYRLRGESTTSLGKKGSSNRRR
jgi:hypothetical protein